MALLHPTPQSLLFLLLMLLLYNISPVLACAMILPDAKFRRIVLAKKRRGCLSFGDSLQLLPRQMPILLCDSDEIDNDENVTDDIDNDDNDDNNEKVNCTCEITLKL